MYEVQEHDGAILNEYLRAAHEFGKNPSAAAWLRLENAMFAWQLLVYGKGIR